MKRVTVVTGSGGLIGSEAVRWFAGLGDTVVGIDNNMRQHFFGAEASTRWNVEQLAQEYAGHYIHHDADIRDAAALVRVFEPHLGSIRAVIHAAAQPSHDWAARDPLLDFGVNAVGTLNLLEILRQKAPEVPFIFTSTNKVYGDTPNRLPLQVEGERFEVPVGHRFREGIDESMSIDRSMHSVFGASKVAADVMTQEYGRYFGMPTVCFRGGCLTGASHSGAELHGFLSYLMKCAMTGRPYTVYGHSGRQVRDNIHGRDLVAMFAAFIDNPRAGEVYNAGGSRFCNCSVREAIHKCEAITGHPMTVSFSDVARAGDHQWWISDIRRFETHFPSWKLQWSLDDILNSMWMENRERWKRNEPA